MPCNAILGATRSVSRFPTTRRSSSSPAIAWAVSCKTSKGGRSPEQQCASAVTTTRNKIREIFYNLRATTGPDGRWRTGGAPKTTGDLDGVRIIHPDYLSEQYFTTKDVTVAIAELRAGKCVYVLKKGVPIEGRVLDADGKPVAGALVISTAHPMNPLGGEIDEVAVSADANGQFRTRQVAPGNHYLIARAPGHSPGDQAVSIETAIPQVEIRLGRAHTIKGLVVDSAGNSIPGAFVNVDTWRNYRCLGVYLFTDTEGRFRWNDAPDDLLMLNVHKGGYSSVTDERAARRTTTSCSLSNPSSNSRAECETPKPARA